MAHTKKSIAGNVNNGSVNTFSYSGSFDVFKASEVEVELDNVALTFTTSTINESASPREYTVDFTNKTVHIGGADLTSTDQVVIQPVTDMGSPTPRATYTAGASVTSADLNNNQLQLLRKAMEYDEQKLSSRGGTMTGNLHMGEDVNLSFEGATDNTFETTITVADPTSDKTITFPDTTGTVVTTGDTGTVATGMIANDAINGDKIANDVINSEHYVASSIDTEHYASGSVDATALGSSAVTTAKINNLAVTTGKIADDAVTAAKLAHTSVTPGSYTAVDLTVDQQGRITAAASGTIAGSEIAADAIDGTKIADNSINSEHYVDGSIDVEHLADNSVDGASIVADAVDGTKIADDSINSEHYVDLSIDTQHIADGQITQPKLAANAVATANILNNQVSEAKIIDGAVTNNKLGADAVNGSKIADNSIDSEHYVDGSIDSAHIGGSQVIAAKLASNSVTESKITDANVTTLKIANANVTLGKLHGDLKQTTISDSDTQLPTSGAVVDYVAAQLLPFGGFEAIATELAFPNTQPASGVIISISDAAGVAVSGTSSNTGRTEGGSTVTINNFPSSLTGETLASGVGLMVSSTGSNQIYNYHKILAAETDVKQLSSDINDFNARYRVGTGSDLSGLANNTLDAGDLFFNTSTQKLLVYNSTNTAWEEAQSIGNFFISTLSPAFDGSTIDFTLSNAPTNVQQVILSINGVIQKPNAGSSRPSEGFSLNGSTVQLPSGSAPANGSDYFAVVMGSTVNIGTPSNGTVDADKLTSGAVTTVKIADGAVNSAKIADGAIVNADVNASAAIAGTKISPVFGSQTITTSGQVAASDIAVSGTAPVVSFTDTNANSDFKVEVDGGVFKIKDITNSNATRVKVESDGTTNVLGNLDVGAGLDVTGNITVSGTVDGVDIAALNTTVGNITTDVVSDTSPQLGGNLDVNTKNIVFGDSAGTTDDRLTFGAGTDLSIYHDGTHSYLTNATNDLTIECTTSDAAITLKSNNINLKDETNQFFLKGIENTGAVELYYGNSLKLATKSTGVRVTGNFEAYPSTSSSTTAGTFYNNSTGASADCVVMIKTYANQGADPYIKFDSGGSNMIVGQSYAGTTNNKLVLGAGESPSGGVAGLQIDGGGQITPDTNNARDLGSSSLRFRNIYTNDLNLSNEGHSNEVDGTWGNWTIQEGESDLFLKNNRSGKKYKFNLTEVS